MALDNIEYPSEIFEGTPHWVLDGPLSGFLLRPGAEKKDFA